MTIIPIAICLSIYISTVTVVTYISVRSPKEFDIKFTLQENCSITANCKGFED